MSGNTAPVFSAIPNLKGVQFTSADTTTKKTCFTAGSDGSRIDAISICTNDTTAAPLAFYLNDGSTDFYLGVVPVPIGSGYTTVPKVDGLLSLQGANLAEIVLPTCWTMKCACVSTMTGSKTTDVIVQGGNF